MALSFGSALSDSSFTGVLMITGRVGDISHGFRVPCQTPMCLCAPIAMLGRISLYEYQLITEDGIHFLIPTATSWHCCASDRAQGLLPSVVELCAGAGGMGVGAEFLGGKVKASVDFNTLSVEHLTTNSRGTVLQLDLTNPVHFKTIHQACDCIGTVTMGFPCQPHSTQGNQLGMTDPRSDVFWSGLSLIFQLQPQAVILECVPAAGSQPAIQDGLSRLAQVMEWDLLTTQLDLQDRWPSRRHRWWALLLPRDWHVLGLQAWPPAATFSAVGDVLPVWGTWSAEDEASLALRPDELAAYLNPHYGADKRLLELHDKASTMLHSYGNALDSCPCTCRAAAFRPATLQRSGLRGFFVVPPSTQRPRYLHPKEAGHLLGFPAWIQHHSDPRAALSLLGLSASPLQMIWLYGTLLANAHRALRLPPVPSPEHWLDAYCTMLVQQVPTWIPQAPSTVFTLDLVDSAHPLQIPCLAPASVLQLLQAHRIHLGWNEAASLVTLDQRLGLEDLLTPCLGPVVLETHPGSEHRPDPLPNILVSITHEGAHRTDFLQRGQFIFELLRQHDIHSVIYLVDDDGKLYGADHRVWAPLKLTTLSPQYWPPGFKATGQLDVSCGLHSSQLWPLLLWLLRGFLSSTVLVLHPLLAHQLLTSDHAAVCPRPLQPQAQLQHVICIFAAECHWALLWGQTHDNTLHWTYSDGLSGKLFGAALALADKLSKRLGFSAWTFAERQLLCQLAPHTCGSIALFHLGLWLGLCPFPAEAHILDFHQVALQLPVLFHHDFLYGLGPSPVESALAALLATKGVPPQAAGDRATAAIKKLGTAAVQAALQQSNPWKELKLLTTKPGKTFQFVNKAELAQYIEQRATAQHGVNISSKKKKDRKNSAAASSQPCLPDPQLLQVLPGHFVDQEQDHVPQIMMSEVSTDTRGIAICGLAEALPFIRDFKSISTDALALLLIEDVPADLKARAPISSLRFPATYLPTSDPLLVQGSILQLGDVTVQRHFLADPVNEMEITDTSVLKIQLYRDELQADWSLVAASPIKQLMQLVPKLRLCTNLQCDHKCGRYHAAVEDCLDQVVHEIWARRFQTLEGRVHSAETADMFQAFLRLAAPPVDELLKVVVEGVYMEPRAASMKTTDPDYSVIWIPGASRDTALHKLRTMSHGLSLVRMKQRYGIRVLTTYEAAAHAELRPGDTFLKVNVTKIYRVHPLPHGLQRAQVAQILKDWHWCAKPLQPARGTADGGAWDIGAETAPPSTVLPAFSKDVLITLIKDKEEPARLPTVVGSRRAQAHLRSSASTISQPTAGDPWHNGLHPTASDPWARFTTTTADTSSSTKRIDALAHQLRADVTAEVTATVQEQLAASSSALPDAQEQHRIQRLEVGMAELQAHQQQFHQWFAESGAKLSAQEEQLQQVTQQLLQQQSEITAVRAEVHTSAETLHQAMQVSFKSMKTDLAADLTTALSMHMDRFETMITAKKSRTE